MNDYDQDGLNDEFIADITFPSQADLIKDIHVFIFFDYGLRNTIKLQMQSFAHVHLQSVSGISKGTVLGNLELYQSLPLTSLTLIDKKYD